MGNKGPGYKFLVHMDPTGSNPMLIYLSIYTSIYFSVNFCDGYITPSHRRWWTLCKPGQNTLKCSRFYAKWLFMWNV